MLQINLLIKDVILGKYVIVIAEERHPMWKHDVQDDAHAPHICFVIMVPSLHNLRGAIRQGTIRVRTILLREKNLGQAKVYHERFRRIKGIVNQDIF